jgi:hypothetical protein
MEHPVKSRKQVQLWIHEIIDRVKSGHKVEDDEVELKANFISSYQAARRIGAHANMIRDPILWLIGVDEDKGVVGVDPTEFASWWAQVKSHFDTVAPTLFYHMELTIDGMPVTALYIDTQDAPFVVENPDKGKAMRLEVPWREGASVRQASRRDLLRIFVPKSATPNFQILSASVSEQNQANGSAFVLKAQIYVIPTQRQRIVVPLHTCSARIQVSAPGYDWPLTLAPNSITPLISRVAQNPKVQSLTVSSTPSELLIDGPGLFVVSAFTVQPRNMIGRLDMVVVLGLTPALAERQLLLSIPMKPATPKETDVVGLWVYKT